MNDFSLVIKALDKENVEYLLIGGVAAVAYGSARLTQDIDILYKRTEENLYRIIKALSPYQPYLRGAPEGLPFDWSFDTLKAGTNFTLTTSIGFIDLLGQASGGNSRVFQN